MRLIAALVSVAAICAAPALAQGPKSAEWPSKLVKIVVPFAPGSTPDAVARILADGLQQSAPSATFIVENKPGASGNIGTDAVAKADPDGSTIGVSIGGPLAINTILFSQLKYDPAKDIAAVTLLATQPSVLAVNASMGVDTVRDLIALLKKEPGKYTYGSIGVGSLSHLAMEAIAQKAGAKMVHLPLQGSPAAMTALLRGDVQIAFLPSIAVTPQLESGEIKILAISTAKRSRFLPDTPTLKEAGIDVEADAWLGLIAPAGTPPAFLARMQTLAAQVITSPASRDKLATLQMEPVANTAEEFRAVIDAEISRWKPVIKALDIKVN
ncbi:MULTISPECIES: tripartite tricarboxylate transporter substrate-binding protein [unclassified Beijerinckia]|uniref:Bug family tripartite tricarboxylate transporter substrate binding protein n=1 Tax=unclassified Beijerinckia TaxID=2638183 RepID=UPI000896123F|nr:MULTISPECIES: tripartite tricarboxylate transporter substrate-binding protein [unclassified Beijerinckia]MDH7795060.1 tripartite-type tricarboxylate transporter receptor subunit TctC [Beijerinckia sp. GAS462]SEB85943.1 Tripartite-type tricarboxylate transporter, receptor component TctC [Beijerinckia sp. 28-YEA-48]